jgi:hypothetical protein
MNGVEVEIIGDMQHRLAVWVALNDIQLPVMSLPYLYEAYQLLGRTDKIEVLKRWFERG